MTKNEEIGKIIARRYTEERKSEKQTDLRQWHQHIRFYLHAQHSTINVAINIS